MTKKILVTRPKHDITTHYLFYWAYKVIELAKARGMSVLDLHKKRANRKEVTSMLEKQSPSLVFFNGHGDDSLIAGHDNEVLIQAGANENLLKHKLVYALACRSGSVLGPKSVESGCRAYIGYEKDFVFVTDKEKTSRPLEDETARLFLEPSNQVVISLLKRPQRQRRPCEVYGFISEEPGKSGWQ